MDFIIFGLEFAKNVDFLSRRLLSRGRAPSLLLADARAGSRLSRYSPRSQAPSAPINSFGTP
ncbi:hypothetical protein J27TS8_34750 [Robertmurraya siralis]|uniref:Uncharacterized protein n=1 Tax=Robertmurraya siralis TaxID=77777 RepID=A0A919WKP3_9BACI|nr:hypothetical protein J27TS8_34750 [Robertmurraya siralis]